MDVMLAVLVLGALLLFHQARLRAGADGMLRAAGLGPRTTEAAAGVRARWASRWPLAAGAALTILGGLVGTRLMGPIGVLFAATGPALPVVLGRHRRRKAEQALEAQLGELAGAVALAVRSGLSIPQSLEFATDDADAPMRLHLEHLLAERRVGTDLESALHGFGEAIGTDDARLLVLILVTHARSGGNLAAALHEVADTIRHRIEARRELHALSAQGRISGAILGALPIGFFVLLAATSGSDLAAVYRSGAGATMVLFGLILEALAYLWIRRLLRIEM
jgi:tight adherence protein B